MIDWGDFLNVKLNKKIKFHNFLYFEAFFYYFCILFTDEVDNGMVNVLSTNVKFQKGSPEQDPYLPSTQHGGEDA